VVESIILKFVIYILTADSGVKYDQSDRWLKSSGQKAKIFAQATFWP